MTTLPFSQRPTETPRAGHRDDAMMEFASESSSSPNAEPPQTRRSLKWVGGLAALALLTAVGIWMFRGGMTGAAAEGMLRIESEPAGASVEVDGSPRGQTPLTVNLTPGQHAVVVALDAQKQEISAKISEGVQSVHYVRFAEAASPAAGSGDANGRLEVSSDTQGATVSVDGVDRGVAPITVEDLEPGEHQVVIQAGGKTQRRTVTVTAGATASLVVTNTPTGSESGWLEIRASTPLQIFEGGKLIGTTEADRIMMPAGVHNLEFVAEALGFRARRSLTIKAGQTTSSALPLPQVPANFNAVPWAEASINGTPIGQTPIANHLLTIGVHDVEFRHPSLGTKRVRVMVSLTEPARVAVDMRTP
jgi:hypothetical protein